MNLTAPLSSLFVFIPVSTIVTAAEVQQRALLLLGSAVLVLVMSLGAWLFYSRRRVGARRALVTAGAVAVVWIVCGYGFAFGAPLIRGFLGNPLAIGVGNADALLQQLAFATFQGAVAMLTVIIVCCAIGDRVALWPWLLFVALWMIVAYSPVAYSEFNIADGWLFGQLQINDQAGGTLVHVSAGAAVLALLLVLRPVAVGGAPKRSGRMLCGAALIWIGAFGLTIGSEGRVDGLFGTIAINTLIAPALAVLAWLVVEFLISGKATWSGAASGAVSGVAAITPACNILTPAWAALLGLLAGAICAATVTLTRRQILGDRLGIVGIHLVGGVLGLVYVGLLGNGLGWKDSGQPDAIASQAAAAIGVGAWSFLIASVIAWLLRKQLERRTSESEALESQSAVV